VERFLKRLVILGGHEDGVAAVTCDDLDDDMVLGNLPHQREQVLARMADAHGSHWHFTSHLYNNLVRDYGLCALLRKKYIVTCLGGRRLGGVKGVMAARPGIGRSRRGDRERRRA